MPNNRNINYAGTLSQTCMVPEYAVKCCGQPMDQSHNLLENIEEVKDGTTNLYTVSGSLILTLDETRAVISFCIMSAKQ